MLSRPLMFWHHTSSWDCFQTATTYPERCGLEGRFAFVVSLPKMLQVEKPDPKIFQITAERAGLRPNTDATCRRPPLKNDVMGAKKRWRAFCLAQPRQVSQNDTDNPTRLRDYFIG